MVTAALMIEYEEVPKAGLGNLGGTAGESRPCLRIGTFPFFRFVDYEVKNADKSAERNQGHTAV